MLDFINDKMNIGWDKTCWKSDLRDVTESQVSKFDKVIEYLLISLLAFMPLAFGAVEAWSEQVVVTLVAAVCITFLLKHIFQRNAAFIWSWAYVPVVLFILAVAFQLIPLPTGLVSLISPNTALIKQELLGDLPNSDTLLKSMTLSFYTNATKHNLRLVLAVVAIFFVVVNVYRREDQIKRLLGAITIIGGCIAVLALAQNLFGNGNIYWTVPTGFGRADSGPFINHSHYCQFMNLSIGAALGLCMIKIHEAFTGKKITPSIVAEYITSPASRPVWLLLAMIIIGIVTIFMSLSRGGMISMLIAACFTTLVLSSKRSLKGRGWIMVLLVLGAFICVLYVGFDAVYDRLSSLQQLHRAEGGRWQIIKDVTVAWTKFPMFGTGLGTHEVVYPMFDRSTVSSLAAHAENEYAQAAEETGIVGLVALAIFGLIIWICYARNIRNASIPVLSAVNGLGFGLLAIIIHSLSDFGQHLPANAFLSAIFCALILILVDMGHRNVSISKVTFARRHDRILRVAILVCASGIWGWALLGANNARIAEAGWKKAVAIENVLAGKGWQGEDEEYIQLITSAARASNYQPDNVKYRHWLNVYRWRSISRYTDPNTGAMLIPEQSMEFVERIIEELNNARLLCPTYGATYCVVGQLQKFILNDPKGAECIRKGYKLAPCDPMACFVMGLLDVEEQRIDASFEKFERAVKLDEKLFPGVVGVYIYNMNRPDLAVDIAGNNTNRLSHIANALADIEEHREVFCKAQARTMELLKLKCSSPDVSADVFASLANIYRKENDIESAIENYRRALTLDYGHVYWRYTLARLLAENDEIPQAIHEARICLRLSPQFAPAEKLIADLSVLPGEVINADLFP